MNSDRNIRAKRHRGQHFLFDKNILQKIVAAAHISPVDTVVEIGAGTGNLTELLARHAQRVVAVEIDKDLLPILRGRMDRIRDVGTARAISLVEIIADDARAVANARFGDQDGDYLVVANIPYNITSLLIRKFLEEYPRPSRCILLIQKEVAQRICARPPDMNILALSVQLFADPKILFPVSRNSFSPKPNVDSAVIELVVKRPDHSNKQKDNRAIMRLITAGFSSKRKLLASNLSNTLNISKDDVFRAFEAGNIPRQARAQELSLDQWTILEQRVRDL